MCSGRIGGVTLMGLALVFLTAGCGTTGNGVASTSSTSASGQPSSTSGSPPSSSPTGPETTWGTWPPGDPRAELTPISVPPVEGYGDYANVEFHYLDGGEVTRHIYECLRDHGFAVTLADDSIQMGGVPAEQSDLLNAYLIACRAGLYLPEATRTPEQWAELYAYKLAVADCLRAEGHNISEPPSLEVFVESDGMWSPFSDLLELGFGEWGRLEKFCPQYPVRGFGAWDPGDPVEPAP